MQFASLEGGPLSHPLLAAVGVRVRELRQRRGWTVRALAEASGLSLRFLAQIEAGSGNVSVLKLVELAGALGTTASALLSARRTTVPMVSLLGLRGAGKTTIGRRLARRLRVPFVELDRRVEEMAGLSLPEVFALHGEEYYRRLERETLERVLAEDRPLVLAAGGGIVTSPEAYELLRRRTVTVWLRASSEDLWGRVLQQGDRRPMVDHPEAMAELRRLLASRESLYARARHAVDTSRLGVEGTVLAIEKAVRGRAAGAREGEGEEPVVRPRREVRTPARAAAPKTSAARSRKRAAGPSGR